MSQRAHDLDVLVVGAGPAGAALAYLLASRGVSTRLVERHADFRREFRGEGLQPSGLRCLQAMGLGRALERVPQTVARTMRIYDGSRFLSFPIRSASGEETRMVSQPRLLEMLVREAQAFPHFRFDAACPVRSVLREQGRVRGIEIAGDSVPIRARLVVGTDGRASTVRRATALEATSLDQTYDLLWARVDLDGFLPDDSTGHLEWAGPHTILAYPSPDGHHQMGVVLAKGEWRQVPRDERWPWILSRASAPLSRALARAGGPIAGPALLNVVCDRLEHWSEPGVLLLGDAAHAMSPVGGQGINMALRDAVVAANHLVPAFAAGDEGSIDRACSEIAEERLVEIRRVQRLQTREGRRLRPPSRLARRIVLPLAARLAPHTMRNLNRRRAALRRGQVDVRLTV